MNIQGTGFKTWRDYQKRLKKKERRNSLIARVPILGLLAGGCFLVLVSIFFAGSWIFANFGGVRQPVVESKNEDDAP